MNRATLVYYAPVLAGFAAVAALAWIGPIVRFARGALALPCPWCGAGGRHQTPVSPILNRCTSCNGHYPAPD